MTIDIKAGNVIEIGRSESGGEYWIGIFVDKQHRETLGPFASEAERERAIADLFAMMRAQGCTSAPSTELH